MRIRSDLLQTGYLLTVYSCITETQDTFLIQDPDLAVERTPGGRAGGLSAASPSKINSRSTAQ